jgi:hypothetical protein
LLACVLCCAALSLRLRRVLHSFPVRAVSKNNTKLPARLSCILRAVLRLRVQSVLSLRRCVLSSLCVAVRTWASCATWQPATSHVACTSRHCSACRGSPCCHLVRFKGGACVPGGGAWSLALLLHLLCASSGGRFQAPLGRWHLFGNLRTVFVQHLVVCPSPTRTNC